jgi:hypothetical protein
MTVPMAALLAVDRPPPPADPVLLDPGVLALVFEADALADPRSLARHRTCNGATATVALAGHAPAVYTLFSFSSASASPHWTTGYVPVLPTLHLPLPSPSNPGGQHASPVSPALHCCPDVAVETALQEVGHAVAGE